LFDLMKLYKVKVEYETVILASSEKDAKEEAEYAIRHEIDDDPQNIEAFEISTLNELPFGWQPNCRPWGKRDEYDRTIEGILKSNVEVRQGE